MSFFLILALCFLFKPSYAQELNAEVSVDKSQISSTTLDYLDNLPNEVETYLNEHDWIDAGFEDDERIGVNLQITLLSVDDNYNFEAQIVVQSRRPIYNSIQESPLFLFNDENWTFNYTPNRGFIHDELQFDALTSVLDFYAYVVLGYDFDSFEEYGGTPYFSKAQKIVSLAQTTSSTGWSRTSGNRRNRAQLVTDLLNSNFQKLRSAYYQYHRKGLDVFLDNPPKARQQVLGALKKIQEAKRNTSTNMLFDVFFNTKYREIVSIFEDADSNVRLEAFNLLSDIDKSHLTEYRKLQ